MKKILIITAAILLVSCAAKKPVTDSTKLYEVLTQQENGGGNIQFYEILSEQKEIAMLQGDENLKGKIGDNDIQKSNFIILNLGEKSSGGYSIGVESVRETADKIIVKVRETKPEPGAMVTQSITYPYAIVKINSKKPIDIQ